MSLHFHPRLALRHLARPRQNPLDHQAPFLHLRHPKSHQNHQSIRPLHRNRLTALPESSHRLRLGTRQSSCSHRG